MTQEIRVEVHGHAYAIRTDLEPDYIQQLAQTVDARMRALECQTESVDTRRLAVLAALNLADELFQLRQALEDRRYTVPPEVLRRLDDCNRLLVEALSDSESE